MSEIDRINLLLHLSLMRERFIDFRAAILDQADDFSEMIHFLEKVARESSARPEEGDKANGEAA